MTFLRQSILGVVLFVAAITQAAAGSMSNYLENKLIDHLFRATSYTAPSTEAIALIVANRGYSSGIRSTAVSSGDMVIPTSPNGHIYKCTTAGTTGSSEPTWPTTAGGTVSDGTAVWTEETNDLEGGAFTEVANSGGYARETLNPSTTNWSNTQNSGSGASSGTNATTENNVAITYGAPTANWGVIWGFYIMDSSTYGSGNPLFYAPLTTPKTVNNGDAAPSFAIDAVTVQIDN